jgi:hypothetical protein
VLHRSNAEERYLVMEAIGRLRQGILDKPLDLWCAATRLKLVSHYP